MSEPIQKYENYAIFKQNNTLELFIALKIAYSCCFGSRGNLDFPGFLQKKFITARGCFRMEPAARIESLLRFAERVRETPEVIDELRKFNLEMDGKLVRVKGRILPPQVQLLKYKFCYTGSKTLLRLIL